MLGFNKKSLCALEAVLDIALYARANPICATDLTQRQDVPKRYLEQIMQALVRAKILVGHRGPHGGYHLARERRHITLGQILRAINHQEQRKQDGHPSPLGRDIITPLCQDISRDMFKKLDNITIEDLTLSAQKKGFLSQKEKKESDFHI